MGTAYLNDIGSVLKELVSRLEYSKTRFGAKSIKMKISAGVKRKIIGLAESDIGLLFFVADFDSKYVFSAVYNNLEQLKKAAIDPYVPYLEFPVDVTVFFSEISNEVSGLEEAIRKLGLSRELLIELI